MLLVKRAVAGAFALAAFATIQSTAHAGPPTMIRPKPAKNLAIMEIQPQEVEVALGHGRIQDTVKWTVLWQPAQFNSIDRKGKDIEIRFYTGVDAGHIKSIMSTETHLITDAAYEKVLNPLEACPAPGLYYGKVYISVRYPNGNLDTNYKVYWSEPFNYICKDRAHYSELKAKAGLVLANPDAWGRFTQVNAIVDMNPFQFREVTALRDNVEARFYVERDGHIYRLLKDRKYFLPNSKSSFTLRTGEVCGAIGGIFEDIWGKDVFVKTRLTVVDGIGRDPRYSEYDSPSLKVHCVR